MPRNGTIFVQHYSILLLFYILCSLTVAFTISVLYKLILEKLEALSTIKTFMHGCHKLTQKACQYFSFHFCTTLYCNTTLNKKTEKWTIQPMTYAKQQWFHRWFISEMCCHKDKLYTVWVKKIPPAVFWHFFPNGWEFFTQFLHTYYTYLSTLDYKVLFNYL